MKRILLTGALGQLGTSLRVLVAESADVALTATDISMPDVSQRLDITDAAAVDAAVASLRPDYIINAAAYTAVDAAESHPHLAQLLNAEAVGNIARAAAKYGARVVHISTDYVFDGAATRPYRETDATGPKTVYGRTKLEGEELLLATHAPGSVILRTAWLYSPYGHNFVKTMLTLGAERDEIDVVADQWGCPTLAADLARAVMAVVNAPTWKPGLYHAVGDGRTTWFDLAREALRLAGNTRVRLHPVSTAEYPTTAQRPPYSVLDTSKLAADYDFRFPMWQESLHHCLKS